VGRLRYGPELQNPHSFRCEDTLWQDIVKRAKYEDMATGAFIRKVLGQYVTDNKSDDTEDGITAIERFHIHRRIAHPDGILPLKGVCAECDKVAF
jgi:hypothetical protein